MLFACAAAAQAAGQTATLCTRADAKPAVASTLAAIVGAETAPTVQPALQMVACDVVEGAQIESAIIEPGARFGRPVRFRLMGQGRQVGYAVAIASGPVRQLRAIRAIASGGSVDPADVAVVNEAAPGALIERLPDLDDVVGAKVVRPVAAGEILTSRLVRVSVAVRSGDRVVIRATVGNVQITGVATAQQSGGVGDVIRLVNVDSRRALRGRVVGKGQVEVVHGS